ncbi:MAG: amidohydrolase family protein [Promethearchaeota archaeon]|jgi:formylmethanofuran dehydrogenase subunit A
MRENKVLIRNGLVYDPINDIEGEIKDILIESGKIIDKFSNNKNIDEIDAKGKTVIPAAIDIHTHVASQQVNWARLIGSNNEKFKENWQGLTLEKIARDYISMGYTFILEANVFPSLAKQTIFNFQQIPVLDKAMLLNISNFWPLELEFQRSKTTDMAVFLSDLLEKTYGFGFKIYNPFENEMWNLKELREDLSAQGRLYNFSGLDVYENVVKCIETMGLPHSAHVHIEGYENEIGKKNLLTVLEKVNSLNIPPSQKTNSTIKREQILHIAHANTYAPDGNNEELIQFLNNNPNFSIDLSFVGFNQINPLITSDRRSINQLITLDSLGTTNKLITSAVEFEGDSFVSLRHISKKNFNDCILWANTIDLALNVSNKSQICFSLNYPNYGNITDIPEILTWLTSEEARNNFMEGMNEKFLKASIVQNMTNSLNFSEAISLTRISPAKSLGIADVKGNLGLGADADINIIDLNVQEVEISKDYNKLKNAFSNIAYVIKSGEVVKKQNKVDLEMQGSIFWAQGKVESSEKGLIMSKKKEFYQKYSSSFYDSLQVSVDNNLLRTIE